MIRKPSSFLAATLAAFSLAVAPAPAETNFGQVAMHVAYMLQSQHYSHRDFDDELSAKLLQNYLNLLDFKHVFFTQEDVDGFKSKYDTTLDDHVLMRNIDPAIEIYDIYKTRVVLMVGVISEARLTDCMVGLQRQERTCDWRPTHSGVGEGSPASTSR